MEVIDKVFASKQKAKDYIDQQPGVQGRKAKWSEAEFGDWCVVEVDVVE